MSGSSTMARTSPPSSPPVPTPTSSKRDKQHFVFCRISSSKLIGSCRLIATGRRRVKTSDSDHHRVRNRGRVRGRGSTDRRREVSEPAKERLEVVVEVCPRERSAKASKKSTNILPLRSRSPPQSSLCSVTASPSHRTGLEKKVLISGIVPRDKEESEGQRGNPIT
jgi:hypothetical protein